MNLVNKSRGVYLHFFVDLCSWESKGTHYSPRPPCQGNMAFFVKGYQQALSLKIRPAIRADYFLCAGGIGGMGSMKSYYLTVAPGNLMFKPTWQYTFSTF